jgi:geranylgeranyl pyrophosphate synthase
MVEAGLRMVGERPLLGLGPDLVKRVYPLYRHPTAPRLLVPHLHNSYVQLAAERGSRARGLSGADRHRGGRRLARLPALGTDADLHLAVLGALAVSIVSLFEHSWGDSEVQRVVLVLLATGRPESRTGGGWSAAASGSAELFEASAAASAGGRGGARSASARRGCGTRRLHARRATRCSPAASGSSGAGGATGELFGAPRSRLPPAGAIELVHTYSLIHDDLPALDDDDLRRGRLTVHRAYDEATAILAGDALLTLGLTTLAAAPPEVAPGRRSAAVELVGTAIGTGGMIGGQALDLETEAAWPAEPGPALERIHLGKTAALLTACLRLGALYADAGAEADRILERLGRGLGLLFQIGDDLLDVLGTTAELGKTAGKDARATKLTYPALYGVDATRTRLASLADQLRLEIAALAGDARLMHSLLAFLTARTS